MNGENVEIILENQNNLKVLSAWINGGRVPHALIIDGIKGTGRTTFARFVAKAVLCEADHKPCGQCKQCLKVDKQIHPDLLVYTGGGTARSFHVDAVRAIKEEAWASPNDADSKVFLLRDTEQMTVQAQNALLKLIEEPPKNVYFILICENVKQMLSTISSRAANLTMQTVDTQSVLKALRTAVPGKSEEEYQAVATISAGNIGKAIEYFESEQAKQFYQTAGEIWQSIKAGEQLTAMSKLSAFEKDKEGFVLILTIVRNLAQEQLRDGVGNETKKPTALQLSQIVDIIEEIKLSVGGNVNMSLLVVLLFSRIGKILQ